MVGTCDEFKGFLRGLEDVLGFGFEEGVEALRDLLGRRRLPERAEELEELLESGGGFRENDTEEEAGVAVEAADKYCLVATMVEKGGGAAAIE